MNRSTRNPQHRALEAVPGAFGGCARLGSVRLQMGSTLRFVSRFARALLEQAPILGQVRVLRQWAASYDVTPDNSPILGRTPTLLNLLQMSGFVGHGFMMAPAIAERMAAWMLDESGDELFTRYNLARFARGQLQREEIIIG